MGANRRHRNPRYPDVGALGGNRALANKKGYCLQIHAVTCRGIEDIML